APRGRREALAEAGIAGVHAKLLAGLAVRQDHRADIRELVLARVGEPNSERLMTARDALQTWFPSGRAAEIGNDEDERPALEPTHPRVEEIAERGERRALETRTLLELVQDPEHLDAAPARGDRALDARAVERCADAIAVARQQPREQSRAVDEEISLPAVDGAEIDGRREIEKEVRIDLAILEVLAHVRRVETCGHVPVDVPNVVTERVLANIREIEALPFEDRSVVTLKQSVQPAEDGPLKPPKAALRRGGRHVPAAVRSERGCARAHASPRRPR